MEEWTIPLVLHHIQEANIVPLSTNQLIILGFTRYTQDKHGDIVLCFIFKKKNETFLQPQQPLRQFVVHGKRR